MPVIKDPEKHKVWREKLSKAMMGKNVGEKSPCYGKKCPALAEWNRQHSGILSPNYGIHRSQETRDKMSRAQSGENNFFFGKHLSQEHRDKIGQANSGEKHPNYGKHPSQKTRDKMRQSHLGKKSNFCGKHHTEETRNKMSKAKSGEKHNMFGKKRPDFAKWCREEQIGEKNNQWKGGTSFKPYSYEFNRQLKELIRLRDGYKCQKCGMPEIESIKKLSIHHIDYQKNNCLPENLITLCIRCNGEVNKNQEKWTKYFQKKVGKEYQNQLCLSIL